MSYNSKHNDWNISRLSSVDSTNNYLKKHRDTQKLSEQSAILADFQTGGKGQGVKTWHSKKGQNLLFSLYFNTGIEVAEHFLLNIITSLSLVELLGRYGIAPVIKWPNDIYVGDNKIAGILIENRLLGNIIADSIVGIGLNVNEVDFPANIPNPVSMKQITGNEFNREAVFSQFLDLYTGYISRLTILKAKDLIEAYNSYLYQKEISSGYVAKGVRFEGEILRVSYDGMIYLKHANNEIRSFLFGDLEYVLKK